tara:strand:+ start:274 stop:867 length:594 start_codon:yes stop_codon:yes gene_type:complete
MEEIEIAFQEAIDIITTNYINTIVWDGDPLTLIDTEAGKYMPVKSFTLIIPKIYEWACYNNWKLQYIYGKKQGYIYSLLNQSNNERDSRGTYYGPYYFLSREDTEIVFTNNYDKNRVASQFDCGNNLAIGFNNNAKCNMLGINLMKWFKENGVTNATLLYVGVDIMLRDELDKLLNIPHEIPNLTLQVFEFRRDSVA